MDPLEQSGATEWEDIRRAQAGNREALETIVRRHQSWIYKLALRMVRHREDAEDITQDILIKLLTNLATFEGRSGLSTWLYRVAVNHVLNLKRSAPDIDAERTMTVNVPDPNIIPADVQLLLKEARITFMAGMLICLNSEQRLIYVLGEILRVSDTVAAPLLNISRENFRQKLCRTRRDLFRFMQEQYGPLERAKSCRCEIRVRQIAERRLQDLDALDDAYGEIQRDQSAREPARAVRALRELIDTREFQTLLCHRRS